MDFSHIEPAGKELFVFGPLQTAWLEALEGGQYRRGTRSLKTIGGAYCCLGVLCEVAKLPWVDQAPMAVNWGFVFGEDASNGYLPHAFTEVAGLITNKGSFKTDRVKLGEHYYYSLAEINDSHALTFPEMAALIRHDPHNVFTHSA